MVHLAWLALTQALLLPKIIISSLKSVQHLCITNNMLSRVYLIGFFSLNINKAFALVAGNRTIFYESQKSPKLILQPEATRTASLLLLLFKFYNTTRCQVFFRAFICQTFCWELYMNFEFTSPTIHEATVIVSILELRKPKHRKVKLLESRSSWSRGP